MNKRLRFEHKISLAYLLIGGLWILFSDRVILLFVSDPISISQLQTYKGWFYVAVTAAIFFTILRWYIVRLRNAQKKAEESDRLKTAFIQNISHEIRTPMNSICGFSNLLNKDSLSPEKRKQYTDIIINNSNQLLSIINDLLSIANIETGQETINPEPVSVDKILNEIYELFQPYAKAKGIEIRLAPSMENKGLILKTDEQKLRKIISNLTSNAVKFTHTGEIVIGYNTSDNRVNLFVWDTGIGIDPEMHEMVFKRFVQADSSIQLRYGGTGLGLTIAKAFTQLLGGTISLESQPNMGTRIQISFPSDQIVSGQTTQSFDISAHNSIAPKDLIILVAEDEEYNYLFIEEVIKEARAKSIRAKNGQEAVDICTENSDIDLVIMDLKMPVMNGYEATKLIKKLRPSLPIIAHTAYPKPHERNNVGNLGFDDYIAKPMNEKNLIGLLEKYR
jgi:signal transduction histidine kinase